MCCNSDRKRQLGEVSCDRTPCSLLCVVEAMLQDMIQRTGRHTCGKPMPKHMEWMNQGTTALVN